MEEWVNFLNRKSKTLPIVPYSFIGRFDWSCSLGTVPSWNDQWALTFFPAITTDIPEPQFYTRSLFKSSKFCTLHLSVLKLSYPFSSIPEHLIELKRAVPGVAVFVGFLWKQRLRHSLPTARSGGDPGNAEELCEGDRKGREDSTEWAVELVQRTVGHSLTGHLRSHGECLVKLSLQRMGRGNIYLQVPMQGWLRIAFWFLGAVFPSRLRLQRKPKQGIPETPREILR